MASQYSNEPETNGKRRDAGLAALVLVLAITTTYLPPATQQGISSVLHASILRPFIGTNDLLMDAQRRAGEIDVLTARLDTLNAMMSTQGALMAENNTLRGLLGLADRQAFQYVPASVLRPGTPGSESMFLLDVGAEHGVPESAPVVGPHGLVGRVLEVRAQTAVGMDWSHPDFRVSAMLADGTTFGIVSPQRENFGDVYRLALDGTAYSTVVEPGTLVVTSGEGDIFPRGIPIGLIDELLSTGGTWRKSYWIEPMVEPGAATHVLVITDGGEGDVSSAWPADSLVTGEQAVRQQQRRPES